MAPNIENPPITTAEDSAPGDNKREMDTLLTPSPHCAPPAKKAKTDHGAYI